MCQTLKCDWCEQPSIGKLTAATDDGETWIVNLCADCVQRPDIRAKLEETVGAEIDVTWLSAFVNGKRIL
jgi:hypothetical protein